MNEIIFNVETGIETIIELSEIEVKKRKADSIKAEKDLEISKLTKATAKADLLAKLGITAEEAKLLLS